MSLRWTGQPIPLLHALVRAGGIPCDMGRALVGTGRGPLPAPAPCPREAERPVLLLDSQRVLLLCLAHVAVLGEHLELPWFAQDQVGRTPPHRTPGDGSPPGPRTQ